MVKLGEGNEKHVKYVVHKHVNFTKSGGIFWKVGGNNNFPEIGGNVHM